MNGSGRIDPASRIRIRPVCSTTNRRPEPSGGATSPIGVVRPLATISSPTSAGWADRPLEGAAEVAGGAAAAPEDGGPGPGGGGATDGVGTQAPARSGSVAKGAG